MSMNELIRHAAGRVRASATPEPPAPAATIPVGNAGAGAGQIPPAPPASMNERIRFASARLGATETIIIAKGPGK